MEFLRELKRRKVIRVASAYIAIGWGLIQIVGEVGDRVALPAWFDSVFVILVLAGLPIAILLAWAFELTPDGVATTQSGETDKPKLAVVDFALLGVMMVLLGAVIWQAVNYAAPSERPVTVVDSVDASIAVLPFADLSDTGDQGYFSDGLSEEILNVLSRVDGIKVASRTSSFSFRGTNSDVTQIASALGVAHVLEGSVRKSGSRLRITTQLIRAKDGFNLWSESYDRQLDDVFAIQEEVSNQILDELQIRIIGDDQPIRVSRADITAYDLVLRARDAYDDYSKLGHETAAALLRQAIDIDPDYAPAYFTLAATIMLTSNALGAQGDRPWQEATAEAKPLIDRGLELAPNDPDGIMKLAMYEHFRGDVEAAEKAYLKASSLQENVNLTNYAVLLNQQYRLNEAIAVVEREREFNPRSPAARSNLIHSYINANRVDDAVKEVALMYEAVPETRGLFSAPAAEAIVKTRQGDWAGTVNLLRATLEETPGVQPLIGGLAFMLLTLRDYDSVMTTGDPLGMSAAIALQGQPQAPLNQLMQMIDRGVASNRVYFGAIYFAGLAGEFELIANTLVPNYPKVDGRPACQQADFPRDLVGMAYRDLGRDEALEALLDCWQSLLSLKEANGYYDAGHLVERAMLYWFLEDPDAAFDALDEAISMNLNDPALNIRMQGAGMLEDPRGIALLERHQAQINRERAKLNLGPVDLIGT